jgi:hypothetical protein
MSSNNKKFFLTDYESGFPYEVTEEDYNAFQRMKEHFMPTIKSDTIRGKIIITSTVPEEENDFKQLWNKTDFNHE